MRHLTATLCLTLAVLLLFVGCAGAPIWTRKMSPDELKRIDDSQLCSAFMLYYVEKLPNLEAEVARRGVDCMQVLPNRAADFRARVQADPVVIKKKELQDSEKKIERIKKDCAKFGFKDGTKEMSNCMFELYKLEKSSSSKTQTVIQNNTGDNSAVRSLLEEQKKQRQFDNSLELMQRGLEMMNPTRPKLTCKYNSLTKTTVCN
jgi:hypothetical protein